MNKRLGVILGLAVAIGFGAPKAHADVVTFNTVPGSDSDGPLAATISFTAMNGFIQVVVTNTENGAGFAKGQAISAFSFEVTGGLSTPTFFTQLSGISFDPTSGGSWTLSSGTSFDVTSSASPPNAIDHWGFQPNGSTATIATAASPVPGSGNPQYMILPSSGTAGSGSSLADSNFDPFIIGPGTFDLTVPGMTSTTALAGDISHVMVSFGTGPDTSLGGTCTSNCSAGGGRSSVPEPTSLVLLGSALAGLGILGRRRRRI